MKWFELLPLSAILVFSCNREPATLFTRVSSDRSGIHFNNRITENDSINPLDLEFLYNGGGVAIGDFNRDGLPDIYFTGNMVSNKMYLNEGHFRFRDITDSAMVSGEKRWCNAASVVDINQDGWDDLYICATINRDPAKRANLLYINQGLNKNGTPTFREMAKAYNLADTGFSVHAAFFDYDHDGDLDLYLLTTKLAQRNSLNFSGQNLDEGPNPAQSDRLYRNEGSDSLGHPWFRDVSASAGIHDVGYGLGIAISDLNLDGWEDIYITNDFFGSDLMYINNRKGGFTNEVNTCLKHTSQNAMGTDIGDINNDGLPDIVSADMNPEDNFRKKKNMNALNYFIYKNMEDLGYTIQYVRNTLQLNQGLVNTDSNQHLLPIFADISFFSGVAETDWSWSTQFADFDNDGFKDLAITNGYPRDVTDHDFAAYRAGSFRVQSRKTILDQIPSIKIPNYIFRNNGHLQFENQTRAWGMETPSFSAGAAYADLDRDGDLDYVISNINDKAMLYQNQAEEQSHPHFLNIKFKGPKLNPAGYGANAMVYYEGGKKQFYENTPFRGYLSSVETGAHFGLGNSGLVDSIRITWPDGRLQWIKQTSADQTLYVQYNNSQVPDTAEHLEDETLFRNITRQAGVRYRHNEMDFIDFNTQRLLPHKLSQSGPGIAVSDINGDGLEDFYIGASANNTGTILLQKPDGLFQEKIFTERGGSVERRPEETGILFFDADGDGDEDLYLASGSNEFAPNTPYYQDRFYLNDGKGNFRNEQNALPENFTSKSCVKAADFDHDGDLDLFVGGRVYPEAYPKPVSSLLLRNDSENGKPRFTDVTASIAPGLIQVGLVCDAVCTDFDNDGWTDLLLAGEWMPLTFFRNSNGKLENITAQTGIQEYKGWWNSLAAGDFDNDGDMDYIAGNLGTNSYYRASREEPARVYAGDFDHNDIYDIIPSLYFKDTKGSKKEFPVPGRDDLIKQIRSMKKRFPNYKSYAVAGMEEVLNKDERTTALVLEATYFHTCLVKNKGKGNFELIPLPGGAQLAPVFGMIAQDFNEDGNLDLLIIGNDFSTEVATGRYDALNGLFLAGKGNGQFDAIPSRNSGFFVPGDAKGLAFLTGKNNRLIIAATQNRAPLLLFECTRPAKVFQPGRQDVEAILHYKNGKKRKVEFCYGNSFLSQSTRSLPIIELIDSLDVTNRSGQTRTIRF